MSSRGDNTAMDKVRLLYVDDEPDIREIVAIALGLEAGLEVRVSASGADALVEAANWRPHLILLDVMMPGMDGPTTLRKLRAQPHGAHVPVVFITARTQTHEVQRLMSLGAAGVIPKPFDPLKLAESVLGYVHKP